MALIDRILGTIVREGVLEVVHPDGRMVRIGQLEAETAARIRALMHPPLHASENEV